ncbi:uncharacterized protein F5147DRAFT_653349 [Suillus discolor]|uniref:Uncharacterized protein n=1 Tax=Suillus discolor TaxID=1912936 RepID=A0A9P7F790_9AGAM|nr:uncharacterized protein F5147DRAFT_653349 [Suillus discolor]KAG2107495.1 hypothetical protein F5147DRAFT_653349 [Suillus discolor]
MPAGPYVNSDDIETLITEVEVAASTHANFNDDVISPSQRPDTSLYLAYAINFDPEPSSPSSPPAFPYPHPVQTHGQFEHLEQHYSTCCARKLKICDMAVKKSLANFTSTNHIQSVLAGHTEFSNVSESRVTSPAPRDAPQSCRSRTVAVPPSTCPKAGAPAQLTFTLVQMQKENELLAPSRTKKHKRVYNLLHCDTRILPGLQSVSFGIGDKEYGEIYVPSHFLVFQWQGYLGQRYPTYFHRHFHSTLSVHVLSVSTISVVLAHGFRMLTQ